MDSLDVAILTKTNALVERFGLKAYDYRAEIRDERDGTGDLNGNVTIVFADIPQEGTPKSEQFDKVLTALGADKERQTLTGTPEQIIDALEGALDIAPKAPPRR